MIFEVIIQELPRPCKASLPPAPPDRELKNSEVITVDYVHTSNNQADQFTKGLSRNVIESASREMGMRPM